MRRQKLIIVLALLFSISSILGCRRILNISDPYPKDQVLLSNFYANREDFDELIRLFQEDSTIFYINSQNEVVDFDRQKIDISDSRLNEYKRFFSKLDVKGINRDRYNKIYLRVWGIPNNFMGSKSKYYVFAEKPPEYLENSLDDIYESGSDSNQFRKIEGNWYLYLDVW